MFKIHKEEIELDGKKLTLETGRIARQADGAIIATYGETVVISTVVGAKKVNEEIVNVFVPTTPNPTSGFLLMVPKKDLIYLDVSFEQASKFIVSAGTSNIS